MKRTKNTLMQTPIKKWQQMSPMVDQLAIVESDISSPEQSQLFTSLVHSPAYQCTPSPSKLFLQEEQASYSQSSSVFEEESMKEESSKTVREMKTEQQNSEQRLPLREIDNNRRGCNCKNSKCQKNYCDCLRGGLVCAPGVCNCEDCHNREEKNLHQEKGNRILQVDIMIKGCNCKKSRCLKKYCECHSNGRKCGPLCQCIECYNRDENWRPEGQVHGRLRPTIEQIY